MLFHFAMYSCRCSLDYTNIKTSLDISSPVKVLDIKVLLDDTLPPSWEHLQSFENRSIQNVDSK